MPATSSKATPVSVATWTSACERPACISPPPRPPCAAQPASPEEPQPHEERQVDDPGQQGWKSVDLDPPPDLDAALARLPIEAGGREALAAVLRRRDPHAVRHDDALDGALPGERGGLRVGEPCRRAPGHHSQAPRSPAARSAGRTAPAGSSSPARESPAGRRGSRDVHGPPVVPRPSRRPPPDPSFQDCMGTRMDVSLIPYAGVGEAR